MNPQDTELQQQLEERLKTLPQAVQNAITSSDIEKRLRELSDKQKLHIDQWQKLENEVMLTLLGFQQAENLETNLVREVGVTAEIAHTLAENINTVVFEPIRQELERQLEHPAAQDATVSDIETARLQALNSAAPQAAVPPAEPAVAPATPPQTPPAANVVRMPASGAYKPGEASTQRASIVDDPYREPPV